MPALAVLHLKFATDDSARSLPPGGASMDMHSLYSALSLRTNAPRGRLRMERCVVAPHVVDVTGTWGDGHVVIDSADYQHHSEENAMGGVLEEDDSCILA